MRGAFVMIMNLYIMFFISLPEAFLNLILILLFSRKNDSLKIRKANILRFSLALILMLTASWVIRPIAGNVAINITLHSIAYILIITIVYRENLIKMAFSVSLILLLYSAVENLYMPLVIAYVCKGIDNFLKNYPMFLVYSIPYRLAQIIVIILLVKTNILLIVSQINRKFYQIFIASSLILVFLEYYFSYIFNFYFDKMLLVHQITFSIALFIMLIVFNLLVLKFIYIAVKGIVTKGFKQYAELEENAEHAFNEVLTLFKNNEEVEAIRLLEHLTKKEEIRE